MIGDPRRWSGRTFTADDVWREIERGAGTRLRFGALQVGDVRCNRTTWGFDVGGRYVPLLDDRDPRDLRARDLLLRAFPGLDFGSPAPLLAAKLLRIAVRHPAVVPQGLAWAARFVRRAGVLRMLSHRPRPLTFVMHSFMDARVVRPAWDLLQRGITADDPEVREAQERLMACSYSMAHPEDGRLVPACAQHAVYDPAENLRLRELLPLVARPAAEEPSA